MGADLAIGTQFRQPALFYEFALARRARATTKPSPSAISARLAGSETGNGKPFTESDPKFPLNVPANPVPAAMFAAVRLGLIALIARATSRAVDWEKSRKSDVKVTSLGGRELPYVAVDPPIGQVKAPPPPIIAVNRFDPVWPPNVTGAAVVKLIVPELTGIIPIPANVAPFAMFAVKFRSAATSVNADEPFGSRNRKVTASPTLLIVEPEANTFELLPTGVNVANVVIADAGLAARTASAAPTISNFIREILQQ